MKAKVRPQLDEELCNGCKACALTCPMKVIKEEDGRFTLHKGIVCEDCSVCYDACPTKAISLIDETHKDFFGVPADAFKLPAKVLVKAYLYENGDKGKAVNNYTERLASAGIRTENFVINDVYRFLITASSSGSVRYFRLDLGVDHFTEQIWHIGVGTVEAPIPAEPTNEKFTDLELILLAKPIEHDEVEKVLGASRPYGSLLFDEKVRAFSSYYPDIQGREKYLVMPAEDEFTDEVEKILIDIVDDLIEVENAYHLLQRPRARYQKADENLSRIETAIAKKIKTISGTLNDATADQMKDWLQDLTTVYSKITTVNADFRDLTMNARMHQVALENGLRDRGERKIFGVTPLSQPLHKNIQSVSQEGARLSERLKELRSEVGDVIAILRTRTNLVVQEQSLMLQKARNKTARSQFKMQKSIEGLYVFIVAYYLTALVKIVLEAVERTYGLPFTVIQGTAAFIPFALVLGLYLSGKITEVLAARRRRRR